MPSAKLPRHRYWSTLCHHNHKLFVETSQHVSDCRQNANSYLTYPEIFARPVVHHLPLDVWVSLVERLYPGHSRRCSAAYWYSFVCSYKDFEYCEICRHLRTRGTTSRVSFYVGMSRLREGQEDRPHAADFFIRTRKHSPDAFRGPVRRSGRPRYIHIGDDRSGTHRKRQVRTSGRPPSAIALGLNLPVPLLSFRRGPNEEHVSSSPAVAKQSASTYSSSSSE